MELDRQAELTAMAMLADLTAGGERFSLLSEEVGLRDYGAPFPLVLLDPVDGSLNAKRGLPIYACMLTLLEGPTVGDATVGHVRNLVTGTTWSCQRGGGARLNGLSIVPRLRPAGDQTIELLGLESTGGSIALAAPLIAQAAKIRIIGSMALSIAHTGAGELDLFCAPKPARLFDMTAGLLMVKELGGVATNLQGLSLADTPVTLEARTTLLVSSRAALVETAVARFADIDGG
jgi:myo-inositol-1(or 4)-monophosphatase